MTIRNLILACALGAGLVSLAHAQTDGIAVSTDPSKASAIEQRAQELRAQQHPMAGMHHMHMKGEHGMKGEHPHHQGHHHGMKDKPAMKK